MARLTKGSQRETNYPQPLLWSGVRCARLKSLVRYPKPVDLCLGRLKPLEREVEGRTDTDVQIVRMTWV